VLDALNVDAFAPAVGDMFVLDDEDAGRLRLELLEARTIEPGAAAVSTDGVRTPFRLLFRGPSAPLMPQRIYRLEHGAIGALEIFIVPVGRDAAGVRYEAIFG
jgi:hypothetical protein